MTTEPPGPEGYTPAQLSYYRIGRVLGSGGMGIVHEATDTRNGITVALKLLHPHLAEDESYRERFQREAHVAALLRSPYTVQLLDYGFEQGRYFLVMTFVDGETVREALRRGPLQPEHALRIAAQVARALEEAEARGVVHRDIKPENIMRAADGAAQVLDFGIARQVGAATLTATGAFIGTLTYASPESFAGEADHRSDIYSLGATLYHALSGRPPFEGDALELLRQQRETPMPREALAGLQPEVVEALARCLEKDPSDRYQSAAELAGVLEHLAQRAGERREPALAAPSTEVITAGGRRTATTEALTLELGPPAVRGRYVPRRRRTSYDLVLRNDRGDPVEFRLDASDAEGRCVFSLPERVSVAAHDAMTVTLEVAPRERRWRGDRETRRFNVSASDGGGPTLTVSGDFDDRPERWLPYAGGGVFAVAVTLVGMLGLIAAPEGGDETAARAQTEPAAPRVVAAPSVGGRIAFVSDRDDDGNIEVYAINADGSGLARLVEFSGALDDPAWSPDGTRVAFAWNADGNSDIYVMNADGSGLTRLTRDPAREITPSWSPDGGRIAFASYRSGNAHIYVMNVDGTDITRLADGLGSDPAWSPDGTRIAFTGMTDNTGAISAYTMNADGTGVTRLTYTSAIDPGWSPDAGTAESGAPKRWLPADPAIDVEHAWSPDGTRIAFASNRDGNFSIYLMSADGSGPVRLTDDAGEDAAPAWSPDGTKIAFTSNRDGNSDIYVMNADGSGLTRLTDDPADDFAPGWWTGAARVVVPETITRAIEVDGGADFFTFDVQSGTSYAISVDPQTLSDVRLLLTFPGELQPRSTAIGRGEGRSELVWTASFSGPVTVSVDSHSGATGSYTLSVTEMR